MEASSSQAAQPRSTSPPPEQDGKRISPSPSHQPPNVASPPRAYIPPHLRTTPNSSNRPSDIDSLSQSINRVTLTDFKPSPRANPNSTKAETFGPKNPSRKKKNPDEHQPHFRQRYREIGEERTMDSPVRDRDTIIQPSFASGGIPDPTPAYLALSSTPFVPLSSAQHLLVVVDLNGTLLHRPSRKQPKRFVARPNTDRFLRYCIDTFTVVIWSSARPENVQNMCQVIFKPNDRSKVAAIWARDKFNFTPSDYNSRVQCYKRLTTLWTDDTIMKSHPEYAQGGRWDQTNTVLIDDSITKGRSEPFNLIEIPEFLGDANEQGHILPQVHDYLNRLAMHSNVSSYMRSHPFSSAQQIFARDALPGQQKMNPDVIEIDDEDEQPQKLQIQQSNQKMNSDVIEIDDTEPEQKKPKQKKPKQKKPKPQQPNQKLNPDVIEID